jgi:hypothetical protein
MLEEAMKHMASSGLKPTILSFNAILHSKIRSREDIQNIFNVFDEMKNLGIGEKQFVVLIFDLVMNLVIFTRAFTCFLDVSFEVHI